MADDALRNLEALRITGLGVNLSTLIGVSRDLGGRITAVVDSLQVEDSAALTDIEEARGTVFRLLTEEDPKEESTTAAASTTADAISFLQSEQVNYEKMLRSANIALENAAKLLRECAKLEKQKLAKEEEIGRLSKELASATLEGETSKSAALNVQLRACLVKKDVLLSPSTSPRGGSSPRSIRLRESSGAARRAGTATQSKSVALPSSMPSRSSQSTSSLHNSQGMEPVRTKQRSGSVWSAASSPRASRSASISSGSTPTLGRHKGTVRGESERPVIAQSLPQTPIEEDPKFKEALSKLEGAKKTLKMSKKTEIQAKEGKTCSTCDLREMVLPCTECWEGQCLDVKCAGMYTLKSLGETQKRLICKVCIEKLKRKAEESRQMTSDGKYSRTYTLTRRPEENPPADANGNNNNNDNNSAKAADDDGEEEATNPMFLRAQQRRRGRYQEEEEEAVDLEDPFENFSWCDDSE